MFDCDKCNGKGRVIVEVYTGLFEFIPCNCKNAEKNLENAKQHMAAIKKRIDDAYKEFYSMGGDD